MSGNNFQHHEEQNEKKDFSQQSHSTKNTNNEKKQPEPIHSQILLNGLMWLLVVSSMIYTWSSFTQPSQPTIPYSKFKQELNRNNIQKVLIRDLQITGSFRIPVSLKAEAATSEKFKSLIPAIGDDELLKLMEENEVEIVSSSDHTPLWISILLNTAPWLVLVAFFIYSSKLVHSSIDKRSGGIGFSKSKAKHHDAVDIETRYEDVAGLESAKKDLQEIIDYLKTPDRYRKLGAKMPKGILMMGPPGCGKTLLAKATAGEAGVPFFSVSASEFIEMFVGVGASRVRDMFNNARKQAPALIFIDEIDSVGRVRGTGLGGGNDEREQTLNQVLAEMDGFSSEEAVVVLAATNRPDVLDPALLRPGRFDRKLVLELPGRKAREDILAVHTRRVPLAKDVVISAIAAETVGFSGADLANLVNEAALRAARHHNETVKAVDFSEARDKIIMGATQSELISDKEKERVAYHEAGHALTAYYSLNTDPINKVSIIPRGRALGMTEQLPTEDRHNYTQNYLEERLCIMLGGRAAEQIHFKEVSSGAADDLKNATHLARKMITQWGMNERIGAVNLQQAEEHPFLGREIAESKQYSEYSARMIDREVSGLINHCEQLSLQRLTDNQQVLNQLAEALIEKESLTGDEIEQLIKTIPNKTGVK